MSYSITEISGFVRQRNEKPQITQISQIRILRFIKKDNLCNL